VGGWGLRTPHSGLWRLRRGEPSRDVEGIADVAQRSPYPLWPKSLNTEFTETRCALRLASVESGTHGVQPKMWVRLSPRGAACHS